MHCPRGKGAGAITCSLEVPVVCGGEVCGVLALDAARPEHQPALVAHHEVVLAALALGLGRPPQQAAVTAPLQTQVGDRGGASDTQCPAGPSPPCPRAPLSGDTGLA